GEASERRARGRVDVLGAGAEPIFEGRELPEALGGLVETAHARERLREPVRARQERALATGEAVRAGSIAVEKRAARAEFATDGIDGAVHDGCGGGVGTEQRGADKGGIPIVPSLPPHRRAPRPGPPPAP